MGARVPPESGRQAQLAAEHSAERPAPPAAQMEHRFFPPSPLLSAFVASLWIHRSAPQVRSRVLPTGAAQLIVDLSGDGLSVPNVLDPSSKTSHSHATRDTFPALVHGPDTLAFPLETDRPLVQVGVDFKPGGVYPFFAPPASVLQNAHVSLDVLWNRQQVADLRDRLVAARTPEECVRLLEHTLLRHLVRPLRHHAAVALALRVLSGPVGPSSLSVLSNEDADAQVTDPVPISQIAQVAEAVGLSSGHFTRVFQEEVGLTPKQFARVRRFRTVLRRARTEQTEQRVNWARLAVECGYYDQAHLTKEFHTFAGVCPSAYLRTRNAHSATTLLLAN